MITIPLVKKKSYKKPRIKYINAHTKNISQILRKRVKKNKNSISFLVNFQEYIKALIK